MYSAGSPILDFYPLEFEQDLNGKKQDWEAIVKIPFIDEGRLLSAMQCKLVSPETDLTLTHDARSARASSH
jgi:5'-3' exonuclease